MKTTTANASDLIALSRMIKYAVKRHGADSQIAQDYAAQYERLSAKQPPVDTIEF